MYHRKCIGSLRSFILFNEKWREKILLPELELEDCSEENEYMYDGEKCSGVLPKLSIQENGAIVHPLTYREIKPEDIRVFHRFVEKEACPKCKNLVDALYAFNIAVLKDVGDAPIGSRFSGRHTHKSRRDKCCLECLEKDHAYQMLTKEGLI